MINFFLIIIEYIWIKIFRYWHMSLYVKEFKPFNKMHTRNFDNNWISTLKWEFELNIKKKHISCLLSLNSIMSRRKNSVFVFTLNPSFIIHQLNDCHKLCKNSWELLACKRESWSMMVWGQWLNFQAITRERKTKKKKIICINS